MGHTHITGSCSLRDGVDPKQTRVRVACIESSDLVWETKTELE